MSGPLSHLKSLDCTTLLPGPFATVYLSDLGALREGYEDVVAPPAFVTVPVLRTGTGHEALKALGKNTPESFTVRKPQLNYAAAKMGVVGLTRSLAKEWGRYNVDCVAYGTIETRLVQPKKKGEGPCAELDGQKIPVGVPEEGRERWKTVIPLGGAGTADEAARVILFFASPLSDYVSGQTLICGGGCGGF